MAGRNACWLLGGLCVVATSFVAWRGLRVTTEGVERGARSTSATTQARTAKVDARRPTRSNGFAADDATTMQEADVAPQGNRRSRDEVTSRKSGSAIEKVSSATAFTSASDCEHLLSMGRRAERTKGAARLASWNVRWFPDGVAEDTPSSSQRTNVEWLACAIAYLNVDAIALQEIKSEPRSSVALNSLILRLAELTREPHAYRLDSCSDESNQHLAWIVNQNRAKSSGFRHHAAINPNGEACAARLRPGFGVNLAFSGGLDLHAIAVHLKSGRERSDFVQRRRSIRGIGVATNEVAAASGEKDVVVLGDFNTMGCDGCEPAPRGAAEALDIDTTIAGLRFPMRRIPPTLGCSHYYQSEPGLLDHVLVTAGTEEVPLSTKVSVEGYCRDLQCESRTGRPPAAAIELSDHCPVVVEMLDRDLDG
ncbi:MAG: endonuclease/exonuclease/phosphatase family protein [Polyangiaceae bacterium]